MQSAYRFFQDVLQYAGRGLGLCLLLAGSGQVQAQVRFNQQQATSVAGFSRGCLGLVCGEVANQELAVDAQKNTAAEITSPLALRPASLRLQFPARALSGQQGAVTLSSEAGLDLALLGRVRVRTYLGGGSTPAQDFAMSSLLTVAIMRNEMTLLTFPVTKDFDQLEVTVEGTATAAYTVRVHYAETYSSVSPLPVTLTGFGGRCAALAIAQNGHRLVGRQLRGTKLRFHL